MRCFLILAMMALCSCSTFGDDRPKTASSDDEEDRSLLVGTVVDTFDGAVDTVQTPLRDLNLMEEDIPDMLELVAKNPYVSPEKQKCQTILDEMAELDNVLGSDKYSPQFALAAAAEEEEEGYLTEGAKMASKMAVGVVGSKVNILPFRGIIRRISGAEEHEREVSKAYQAGQLRRAYLRGMADSKGMKCNDILEVKAKIKKKPEKKYNYAVSL